MIMDSVDIFLTRSDLIFSNVLAGTFLRSGTILGHPAPIKSLRADLNVFPSCIAGFTREIAIIMGLVRALRAEVFSKISLSNVCAYCFIFLLNSYTLSVWAIRLAIYSVTDFHS